MSQPKHVWKRGNRYYVRARIRGKQISQSLETSDRAIAERRAKKIVEAARAERWDFVDEAKVHKGYATIGQVVARFKEEAVHHDLRARTTSDYVAALYRVLRTAGHPDPVEDLAADVLTRETVKAYAAAKMRDVDPDTLSDVRMRRTINFTLRQARAVFSIWAREEYMHAGLKLPDLTGFLKTFSVAYQPKRYALPPEPLRCGTFRAAAELRVENEGLWTVFLLCYYMALRAGEAAAAKWSWIVEEQVDGRPRWFLHVINRPEEGFKAKGSEGKVPVPEQVLTWLQSLRRDGDEYILPGGTPSAREDLIERDFALWMRDIGWDAKRYIHAAHELRALRGCEWYTRRGLEAACEWLRHADPRTTKQFYSAFTRQPPALEVGEGEDVALL